MGKTVKSDENLFGRFGLPSTAAINLQIRSSLMIELAKFIEHRGMTQVQAAEFFGVSQPYISDLMNGRIDRVSIDRLVSLLDTAGQAVTVTVGARRNRQRSPALSH